MKDKFLGEVELRLSTRLSDKDREAAMQCIIASLNDYDVTRRVTDLTVRHEDVNERLIKRFAACLRIDGRKESTVGQYVRTLRKLDGAIGKPFTEMSAYEIRYFLGMLKERGLKNQTIENQRANISSFFTWLFDEEEIERNPCGKISPVKVEKVIRLPFSYVEIDKLRGACEEPKDRAVIETLLSSGVRCEELCSLEIPDVDLEKKTVRVRNGKGGKDRMTFISDVAAEHLGKYLETRTDCATMLFYSPWSKGSPSTNGIRNVCNRTAERAGVDDVHPHRFRRTFATDLYRRGMDIYSISRLMGHSNIETTKRYIYMADDQLQADYRKYSGG